MAIAPRAGDRHRESVRCGAANEGVTRGVTECADLRDRLTERADDEPRRRNEGAFRNFTDREPDSRTVASRRFGVPILAGARSVVKRTKSTASALHSAIPNARLKAIGIGEFVALRARSPVPMTLVN
ncbi:MAG: hypothetical protein NVS2B3_04190 [Vulcanimicrobiaceae bacterium]